MTLAFVPVTCNMINIQPFDYCLTRSLPNHTQIASLRTAAMQVRLRVQRPFSKNWRMWNIRGGWMVIWAPPNMVCLTFLFSAYWGKGTEPIYEGQSWFCYLPVMSFCIIISLSLNHFLTMISAIKVY